MYVCMWKIDVLWLYRTVNSLYTYQPILTKLLHISSRSPIQPNCYHLLPMRMTSHQGISLLYLTYDMGLPYSSLPVLATLDGEILVGWPSLGPSGLWLVHLPSPHKPFTNEISTCLKADTSWIITSHGIKCPI